MCNFCVSQLFASDIGKTCQAFEIHLYIGKSMYSIYNSVGLYIGNHGFSHEIWDFPVIFPIFSTFFPGFWCGLLGAGDPCHGSWSLDSSSTAQRRGVSHVAAKRLGRNRGGGCVLQGREMI